MPMCTYLGYDQYTQRTSDEELNSLLAEIRKKTGKDWRLREVIIPGQWPWSKPRTWYDVYNHVSHGEFQVINFYHPDGEFTTASVVAAYFYGLLGSRQ